ncbi:18272_t:CDS:2 [Entrophospora sp. SA101]|nr:18272_t:CDS:2 [Entrophospora sp. SA101]
MFSSTNDMIIGAMSGIISKTGVFPLDLIRKRMQLQIPPSPKQKYFFINYIPLYTNSIIVNIKTIIRNEGFCGLYRGLTPAIIKAAPVSAKNRGKRKVNPSSSSDIEPEPKRVNADDESRDATTLDPKANAYLKEMQKYNERLCKDETGHVRPLVK